MEITLTPELERLINDQVASGNYPSAGDVVEEALRLFKDHLDRSNEAYDDLRRKVGVGIEALKQGQYADFEADEAPRLASEIKEQGRKRRKETEKTAFDGQ